LVELEFDTGFEVDGDDTVRAFGEVVIEDLFSDVEEVEFVVAKGNVNIEGEVFFVFKKEFFVEI